jgi:hypothetical protein
MQKINIIGQWAHHIFRDKEGNDVYVECSIEEYNKLALSNDSNPVPPEGMTWVGSRYGSKFDTQTGVLEKGTYFDYDNTVFSKPAFGEVKELPVEEVAQLEATFNQEVKWQ